MAPGNGSARNRRRSSNTTASPTTKSGTNRSGSVERTQFTAVWRKYCRP